MNRREIVEELIKKGYKAEAHDVIKNGLILEGIIIRGEGAIAPIIYTNEIIELAEKCGANLSEVANEVIRVYKQHTKIQFNIDQFYDRKFILTHVYVGIQKASNEEIEKKKCELEGLESFLYVRDRIENGGGYSAKVNKHMLKLVNLDADEAWERAKENSFAETEIQSLTSVLSDLGGMPYEVAGMKSEFPELYIISNKCRFRGASAILDKKTLKSFAKEHGVDELMVLPSSIHEMLILPYQGDMNLNDLSAIVRDTAYLIKL